MLLFCAGFRCYGRGSLPSQGNSCAPVKLLGKRPQSGQETGLHRPLMRAGCSRRNSPEDITGRSPPRGPLSRHLLQQPAGEDGSWDSVLPAAPASTVMQAEAMGEWAVLWRVPVAVTSHLQRQGVAASPLALSGRPSNAVDCEKYYALGCAQV